MRVTQGQGAFRRSLAAFINQLTDLWQTSREIGFF